MQAVLSPKFAKWWMIIISALLVIQYARPQGIIGALAALRPYMLVVAMTLGMLIASRQNLLQMGHTQMQIIWATIFLMGLSIPFSTNYGHAFGTTKNVLMFFPFMLSVLIVVTDVKKLKMLINVFIFIGLFNAIRGLMIQDGMHRNTMFNIGNFLTDPNEFSLYMNLVLPFVFFMFMQERRWNLLKFVYLGAVGIMVLAIVSSFSRGGFVGLLCVAAVCWWYSPNKKFTTSVAVIAVVAILAFSPEGYLDSMGSTTDMGHGTVRTRLNAWIGAFYMFLDYPVMGVGPWNTPFLLNDYVPYHGTDHWYGSPSHSVWMTALAEGGIIGMTLFLMLIYVNYRDSLRLTKTRGTDDDTRYLNYFGAACIGSLAAYLASGTFLTVNYYPHLWYLSAIIAAGTKISMLKGVQR